MANRLVDVCNWLVLRHPVNYHWHLLGALIHWRVGTGSRRCEHSVMSRDNLVRSSDVLRWVIAQKLTHECRSGLSTLINWISLLPHIVVDRNCRIHLRCVALLWLNSIILEKPSLRHLHVRLIRLLFFSHLTLLISSQTLLHAGTKTVVRLVV
jgi:hypothetical protein